MASRADRLESQVCGHSPTRSSSPGYCDAHKCVLRFDGQSAICSNKSENQILHLSRNILWERTLPRPQVFGSSLPSARSANSSPGTGSGAGSGPVLAPGHLVVARRWRTTSGSTSLPTTTNAFCDRAEPVVEMSQQTPSLPSGRSPDRSMCSILCATTNASGVLLRHRLSRSGPGTRNSGAQRGSPSETTAIVAR